MRIVTLGRDTPCVVLLLGILAGCGPRMGTREAEGMVDPAPPDESTSTGNASRTATSIDPSTGDDEPLVCPEGEVACGDECADLRWSERHCGACGHACNVVGILGECWEGVCPPTAFCGRSEQGYETCASVCQSHGETCVDTEPEVPGSCGGGRYRLFYELTPDFDCEVGFWSSTSLEGGCNAPIQWDLQGGFSGDALPGAVACCCTQP